MRRIGTSLALTASLAFGGIAGPVANAEAQPRPKPTDLELLDEINQAELAFESEAFDDHHIDEVIVMRGMCSIIDPNKNTEGEMYGVPNPAALIVRIGRHYIAETVAWNGFEGKFTYGQPVVGEEGKPKKERQLKGLVEEVQLKQRKGKIVPTLMELAFSPGEAPSLTDIQTGLIEATVMRAGYKQGKNVYQYAKTDDGKTGCLLAEQQPAQPLP
jgi:hypothetical protein